MQLFVACSSSSSARRLCLAIYVPTELLGTPQARGVNFEVFGSISEHTRAHFRHLAERSKGPGAIDRTRYGQLRGSTRSFRRHHLQQLVKAAVVGDSEAILRQITSLKQRAFGAAPAAAGGSVRDAGA